MNYIVENEELVLQYLPGNGAWTYQLIIPNTKDIKGKWGDLKVSGSIDGYEIKYKNLGPVKNADKKLAINNEIRTAIGKQGGDKVRVTLHLENPNEQPNNQEIFECLSDAGVLKTFKSLAETEQNELLSQINATATVNLKADKIINLIARLERKMF